MPTYRTQVDGTFEISAHVTADSAEEATHLLTCMLTAKDNENVTHLTTYFNGDILQAEAIVEAPQIRHRGYVSMSEVLASPPAATIPSRPLVDGYTRLVN